jgi:hypothetical protein
MSGKVFFGLYHLLETRFQGFSKKSPDFCKGGQALDVRYLAGNGWLIFVS